MINLSACWACCPDTKYKWAISISSCLYQTWKGQSFKWKTLWTEGLFSQIAVQNESMTSINESILPSLCETKYKLPPTVDDFLIHKSSVLCQVAACPPSSITTPLVLFVESFHCPSKTSRRKQEIELQSTSSYCWGRQNSWSNGTAYGCHEQFHKY